MRKEKIKNFDLQALVNHIKENRNEKKEITFEEFFYEFIQRGYGEWEIKNYV